MKCISIDDNPVDLRLIRTQIKEDHRLTLVGEHVDPIHALHEIQKIKPDLICLDYKFNNYNADEVMHSSFFKPNIILVTSHVDDFRFRMIENLVGVLHKPINPLDFKLVINNFVNRKSTLSYS